MRIDKNTIINGLTRYVETQVIPAVPDKGFQIMIAIGVNAVRSNKQILNRFLDNDMFRTIADYDEKDQTYDIDKICNVLKESISSVGYFPVKIPAVSFVSPVEKELKFSAEDIDVMKEYMVVG